MAGASRAASSSVGAGWLRPGSARHADDGCGDERRRAGDEADPGCRTRRPDAAVRLIGKPDGGGAEDERPPGPEGHDGDQAEDPENQGALGQPFGRCPPGVGCHDDPDREADQADAVLAERLGEGIGDRVLLPRSIRVEVDPEVLATEHREDEGDVADEGRGDRSGAGRGGRRLVAGGGHDSSWSGDERMPRSDRYPGDAGTVGEPEGPGRPSRANRDSRPLTDAPEVVTLDTWECARPVPSTRLSPRKFWPPLPWSWHPLFRCRSRVGSARGRRSTTRTCGRATGSTS